MVKIQDQHWMLYRSTDEALAAFGSSYTHNQRAADAVYKCVKVTWDETTVRHFILSKLCPICPLSHSQLWAALYLPKHQNQNTQCQWSWTWFACPCWRIQPPLSVSPSPLWIMWPSQSKTPGSSPSLPQQAQRVEMHTNKAEGHFWNYQALQPPSHVVQEMDADNSNRLSIQSNSNNGN